MPARRLSEIMRGTHRAETEWPRLGEEAGPTSGGGEERGDWPDDSNWLHLRLGALPCLGNSRETFGPIAGAFGQALLVIDPKQIRDVIDPLLIFRR